MYISINKNKDNKNLNSIFLDIIKKLFPQENFIQYVKEGEDNKSYIQINDIVITYTISGWLNPIQFENFIISTVAKKNQEKIFRIKYNVLDDIKFLNYFNEIKKSSL